MASLATTGAVKEHHDFGSDPNLKPQLATDRELAELKEPELQRYWARSLALICIPSIITAWYAVIWVRLVLGIEHDDATRYRTFSGSLIYYSWFIIGVFGLGWAEYGLAGVEAAMLQTRFWRAPNLIALLMHSSTTWSSPSGWLKAIYHREFYKYKLWCLLSFLSLLPFIAFPLSGLVFEISDGYIKTSAAPVVIGHNMTTYNRRILDRDNAEPAWIIGTSPVAPGFGVIYTPRGVDRTEHSFLEQVPNTLPLVETALEMFLAPQANIPVSGRPWGLWVKYDCSNVRNASEFTILSEKHMSTLELVEGDRKIISLRTPSGSLINVYNSSASMFLGTINTWQHAEIGMSVDTDKATPYEDVYQNDTSQSTIVLEYALWQVQYRGYYDKPGKFYPFDTNIGQGIEGMGGPVSLAENKTLLGNETFYKIKGGQSHGERNKTTNRIEIVNGSFPDLLPLLNPRDLTGTILDVAPPIGARCVISSSPGMATLDGVTSTFSNFERADPDAGSSEERGGVLGNKAQKILSGREPKDLYGASHVPGRLPHPDGSLGRFQSYLNSDAVLHAMMLAYDVDALDRMYNLNSDFQAAWVNTNLTSSREGKILTIASLIPRRDAGHLVLALFCIWSALSIVVGVTYGFRKRPSDKLDGEAMLRHGAENSDDLKQSNHFSRGQSFYDNKAFKTLPGS